MKVIIINGPNLNLLGRRETDIYGDLTFEEFYETLVEKYPTLELSYYQSNIEGELIDKLQEVGYAYDGIILNAAAYTHTSVAIYDALKTLDIPIAEVHLTNVYSRESFRHSLLTAQAASIIMSGLGKDSYHYAANALNEYIHRGIK